MSALSWKRANTPEKKEERRRAVLQAAVQVLERDGPIHAGMSAIAREVGLSKGNLYRYFESRETIYLHVLLEDYEAWVDRVVVALGPLAGSDEADAVVQTLVHELVKRPRLLTLSPLVSSMLNHNVPSDVLIWFKSAMFEQSRRATRQLQTALPSLSMQSIDRFMASFHYLVNGMAPMAEPPGEIRDALKSTYPGETPIDFENELHNMLVTVICGLRARSGSLQ